MQGANRQLGRGGDDLQQGQRRAGWMAAVLFPILQGAHAHPQQARELALGQPNALAHGLHVQRLMIETTRGFAFALGNRLGLRQALYQLIEQRRFHLATP